MKYKNVVWDWNGTLLNDVKVGVNTLNDMLGRRGLPLLSVEDYKEKFGFPVIDFYDRVGFDMEKESFHELSVDFVETYDKYAGEVGRSCDCHGRQYRDISDAYRGTSDGSEYLLSCKPSCASRYLIRETGGNHGQTDQCTN